MTRRTSHEPPDTLMQLLTRLDPAEDVEVEYKRAHGGIPRDVWESISAFANTRGGCIVLGVNESGGFEVEGVSNADARRKELWDALRNPQKLSSAVCDERDVSVEHVDGAALVIIRVPAVPRTERPVYINGNPYQGTYVRRHSADYKCGKPEVDRMIREASGDHADLVVLEGFGLADLDRYALSGYRNRFQTHDPANPKNELDDWAFLKSLGGAMKDRRSGVEALTRAGLLMFGLPEAIREWRGRHLIDFRSLSGTTDVYERWLDRIAWEGHLYGAFFTIFPGLTVSLPTPFELQDEVRSGQTAVHTALREALVNLLVHADYVESEASLILRSPDGFLFRNPGTSRVPEDDMLIGNRSDPRNPTIARMFRQIGLAEEAGTGIPKIVQLWRKLGFQLPDIHQSTERYEFTIELRYAHLIPADDRNWLQSLGDHWTEEEQLALVLAKHEGMVDNQRLRSLTGVHPADATAVLGRLRQRGLLDPQGGGSKTWYQLSPHLREDAGLPDNSERIGISPEEWDEMVNLARPLRDALRQRKRPARLERDRTIVALCRRMPLALEELEELLGYTRSGMRGIVQDLVKQRALQYRYPERPTHPHQRYLAGDSSHVAS